MKKHLLSICLSLLSVTVWAQTSHWTQSFNSVLNQSFNRVAYFQGFNDIPGNPPQAVNSIFTVGQTQHMQSGSLVIPAAAQPRYSWGGNPFQVASGINAVKIYGIDVYPNPDIDNFNDEVWIAGHKRNSSPANTSVYTTGTIQRRVLNAESNFTEIRSLAASQFFDISINKSFGGEGIAAVGRATQQNQAFISISTDNGLNWSDYEHITTEQAQLNAVKYASADVIYAVGGFTTGSAAPLVLKSTDGGANWVELTVGLSGIGTLNDLAVAGENNVWAVGTNGKIVHTNNGGTSWSEQTSNNTENLLGIFFLDAQKGWLVGGNGTIMKTLNGGQTWSVSPINSTLHFADIAFVNEDEGIVIALDGTIFSYIGCSPVTGTLTVDGPTSVCADGEATFSIQIGQQNVTDYIWEYNGSSGTLTNGSVTVTAPSEGQGSPSLVIYGSNECSQGSQFSYSPSVVGTPAPFAITAPVSTCAGNFVAVSVESTGIPVTWQMPAGWVQNTTFPNNNGGQFTAGESGTISFTRDNGCFTRTETHEVTVVESAPALATMANSDLAVCPNETTLLSVIVDSSATTSSFFFQNGWTYLPDTDTSFFVTAVSGLSSVVTHYSGNVCGTTETQFTLSRLPETFNYSPIYEDQGVLYVQYPTTGVGHQWLLNGNPIPGANGISHIPSEPGTYSVEAFYTDYNCQSHIGNEIEVFVVGVNESASRSFGLYPNPFNSEFIIETTELTSISVINAIGEVVLSRTVNGRTSIDATSLSAGIYFVREEISGAVMKLVKN